MQKLFIFAFALIFSFNNLNAFIVKKVVKEDEEPTTLLPTLAPIILETIPTAFPMETLETLKPLELSTLAPLETLETLKPLEISTLAPLETITPFEFTTMEPMKPIEISTPPTLETLKPLELSTLPPVVLETLKPFEDHTWPPHPTFKPKPTTTEATTWTTTQETTPTPWTTESWTPPTTSEETTPSPWTEPTTESWETSTVTGPTEPTTESWETSTITGPTEPTTESWETSTFTGPTEPETSTLEIFPTTLPDPSTEGIFSSTTLEPLPDISREKKNQTVFSKCKFTTNLTDFTITNPNYPKAENKGEECQYTVVPAKGFCELRMEFVEGFLESRQMDSCTFSSTLNVFGAKKEEKIAYFCNEGDSKRKYSVYTIKIREGYPATVFLTGQPRSMWKIHAKQVKCA